MILSPAFNCLRLYRSLGKKINNLKLSFSTEPILARLALLDLVEVKIHVRGGIEY